MLSVVVADSFEVLAARLVDVLAAPPADPFVPDWVAVPPGAARRWLALRLAADLGASTPDGGDGIAANISFARPGAMRRAVLDADPSTGSHVWTVDRVARAVLAVQSDVPGLPTSSSERSIATWALGVADHFDRYQVYRPEMIRSWASGELVDTVGRPLRSADRWQADLWRAVRDRFGEPSPAERLPTLLDAVRSGSIDLDLPERLALFGFASLPGGASFGGIVTAVAAGREVHLYLLDAEASRPATGEDGSHLARVWGGLARETVSLVDALAAESDDVEVERVVPPAAAEPTTTLQALQRSIATGSPGDRPFIPDPDDRSIQVHGCQGPTRQVEVARDAILHLLATDSTLREDDVLICCPDLDRFAPLISSVFGVSQEGPQPDGADAFRAPGLRYRIVDSGVARENPMVDALLALLDLIPSRFTSTEFVSFCSLGPVRRRWGFTDDDLTTLRQWVDALGIRWGIDTEARARFGVPVDVVAGTWQRALDRLLLGAALPDEARLVDGDLLPTGLEGSDVALVGKVADLLGRLSIIAADRAETRRIADRLTELRRLFESVMAPDPERRWQADIVHRALGRLDDGSQTFPEWADDVDVTFVDLATLVRSRLGGGGGSQSFFTGGVTVTSLGAIRGVPFRVICVLGFDESSLPTPSVDGDDLSTVEHRPGDPDRTAEFRQSLLAAVVAAGDNLIVLHDDRDVASNAPVPPAMVLHDLLDELATVAASSDHVFTFRHPRHATDPVNFRPQGPTGAGPWSFDRSALSGARARLGVSFDESDADADVAEPTSAVPTGAAAVAGEVVERTELRALLADSAKFFCSRVLDVTLIGTETEVPTALRVDFDALERWNLRTRLVERASADPIVDPARDPDRIEAASDALPVGVFGDQAIAEARRQMQPLFDERHALTEDASVEHVVLRVPLANGRSFVGTLDIATSPSFSGVVDFSASKPKAKDRFEAWVDLLLLTAARPDTAWQIVQLRVGDKAGSATNYTAKANAAGALDVIEELVGLLDAARAAPVPFFPELTDAIVNGSSRTDLAKVWAGLTTNAPCRFLYDGLGIDDLLAEVPWPDDPGMGTGRVMRIAEAISERFDDTVDMSSSSLSEGSDS